MKWMLWQFGKLFEEEGETREFIGIWKDSKARSAFKEKYWVCGHLVCPTGLIFFLKETSVGCFESFQIIKFSSCVFHLTSFLPNVGRQTFALRSVIPLASTRGKWLCFEKTMQGCTRPGRFGVINARVPSYAVNKT